MYTGTDNSIYIFTKIVGSDGVIFYHQLMSHLEEGGLLMKAISCKNGWRFSTGEEPIIVIYKLVFKEICFQIFYQK